MPGSDTLQALIGELDAMPRRARNHILKSLSAAERDAVEAASRRIIPDRLASATAETTPMFSPWLAQAIDRAASSDFSPATHAMTAASRNALLTGARAMEPRSRPAPAGSPKPPGRSLIDAFGGALTARRFQ